MTPLLLQGEGRVLGVRSGDLAVLVGGEVVATRAVERVEEVHLVGDAQITPGARELCLRRGVDVLFYAPSGHYHGRLLGVESPAGGRRLAQLRAALDPATRVRVASAVVAGKVANQETHLRRVQRRARSEAVADALGVLRGARERALGATDLDVLRGHEGLAARAYFGALGGAVANPLFAFPGRTRRPPTDPVNAALSFAYTLLVGRVDRAVRAAGLDVYVGFLHEATRGAAACALDLAEEVRPLVDAMVFGLVNRRELAPEDFRVPGAAIGAEAPAEPRAIHLAELGREIVFRTWWRRMQEPLWVEGAGARLPLGQAIAWQAGLLARVVEGREPVYAPLRWT